MAVAREAAVRTLRTVGVVAYDETRLVDVNLQIEGWIRELHADFTGKLVERGDPLFTLYSPELLSTEQEYVLALETRDALEGSQVPEVRDHADRLIASARRRLELWDLPVDHLETRRDWRRADDGYVPVAVERLCDREDRGARRVRRTGPDAVPDCRSVARVGGG